MSLLAQKNPAQSSGAHTDSAEAFVPDQSRAERRTSYDVADFPVPGGREEEWRFTPVDRLKGLFAQEASTEGAVTVTTDVPEGVEVAELPMDDGRVGSAYRPADRAAVTAWAGAERFARGLTDPLDAPARARWPLDPAAEKVRGAGVKA